MGLNKLKQGQIYGDSTYSFNDLDEQLHAVEDRTRVPAILRYNTYLQWSLGVTKTNIDFTTQMDKITIESGQTEAIFESYIIDTGSLSNVKFTTFSIIENIGTGTIAYSTRTADTEEGISTASYVAMGSGNTIASPNGRYIQFKIIMNSGSSMPVVTSVGINVMGSATTQEVYDARGGYKTLDDRLKLMNSMARIEYTATEGQTIFNLPTGFTATGAGENIFVYVNSALQTYGSSSGYLFNLAGTAVVLNSGLSGPPYADKVTIIANHSNTILSNTITPASDITLNTAPFNNNLDNNVTNVQLLAEIVDQLTGIGNGVTSADLSTEVSTRESAITNEASIRSSADTVLSTNLSTEASVRESADTAASLANSTALSTEISTRESADTVLSIAISTEVSTRVSFDSTVKRAYVTTGSFAGNGSSAVITISGPSDTNYAVSVTPIVIPTNPGTIGEIYAVRTSSTQVTITNTGSATTTFSLIVLY